MTKKTEPVAPLFGIEPANYAKWSHVHTPAGGVLTMEKLNAAVRMVKERSGRDTGVPSTKASE